MNVSARPNTNPNTTGNETITQRHTFKPGAYACTDVCSVLMEAPFRLDKNPKSTHQAVLKKMNTPPTTIQGWVEFSVHYGNTKAAKYTTKNNPMTVAARSFASLMNDVHTKIQNGDTAPAIEKLNIFTNELTRRITVANGSLPNNHQKMLAEIQELAICIKETLSDTLSTEEKITPSTSKESLPSSSDKHIQDALTQQDRLERSRLLVQDTKHSNPPSHEDEYNYLDKWEGISDISDPDPDSDSEF